MEALGRLGGPTWFRLGDGDLATHVDRTRRQAAGETLTAISAHLAAKLGVRARVLPMSDDRVRTVVETDRGTLAFQEYFVREQCRPAVRAICYDGAAAAGPSGQVLAALAAPTLAGIVVCPSNPWLSVDPILAVPGIREALRAGGAPVIAVSPIIGGKAVKGPAAKIMAELGIEADARSIASHYAGLIDGFVLDREDAALEGGIPVPTLVTNTMMRTLDDKIALARECLAFCDRLAAGTGRQRAPRGATVR
jgi:LPPG:FO 2-phospho-L-lactate transferase